MQIKWSGYEYWSIDLKNEGKAVARLNKIAIASKDPNDERLYKRTKNRQSRNIKAEQKRKLKIKLLLEQTAGPEPR